MHVLDLQSLWDCKWNEIGIGISWLALPQCPPMKDDLLWGWSSNCVNWPLILLGKRKRENMRNTTFRSTLLNFYWLEINNRCSRVQNGLRIKVICHLPIRNVRMYAIAVIGVGNHSFVFYRLFHENIICCWICNKKHFWFARVGQGFAAGFVISIENANSMIKSNTTSIYNPFYEFVCLIVMNSSKWWLFDWRESLLSSTSTLK